MSWSIETHGAVWCIHMQSNHQNRQNEQFLDDAEQALSQIHAHDHPIVIILTGQDAIFSVGLDLDEATARFKQPKSQVATWLQRYQQLLIDWFSLNHPMVAAINGHALAGGMLLGLCADYRIGSHQGLYGLNELELAFPMPKALLGLSQYQLGIHSEYCLQTAARLTAEQACAYGLLHKAVAADQVLATAWSWAQRLDEDCLKAYQLNKQRLRQPTITHGQNSLQDEDFIEIVCGAASQRRQQRILQHLKNKH